MSRFLWICLGGALGTGARYLVSEWAIKALGPGFPYGTLAVNALGSFLIGAVMSATAVPEPVRVVLVVGVLGGFTTYSAFSYETLRSLQAGEWGAAVLSVVVTVAGCLLASWLGWTCGKWNVGS